MRKKSAINFDSRESMFEYARNLFAHDKKVYCEVYASPRRDGKHYEFYRVYSKDASGNLSELPAFVYGMVKISYAVWAEKQIAALSLLLYGYVDGRYPANPESVLSVEWLPTYGQPKISRRLYLIRQVKVT